MMTENLYLQCSNRHHVEEIEHDTIDKIPEIYKNVTAYVTTFKDLRDDVGKTPIVIGVCRDCYEIYRNNPLELVE